MKKLLLIIDPQFDFIEGGNLPVKGAEAKMNALATYINENSDKYNNVIITADWHPFTHCSFTVNGGEWPMHCVDHTSGAAIWTPIMMAVLSKFKNAKILHKGIDKDKEEYSIIQNGINGKWLLEYLAEENFDSIDVCGIAGDVCVLNTISDLCEFKWGDKINILSDFIASLDDGSTLKTFAEKENVSIV